mmetsp:Transcript_9375/g.13697  ORF Transcript_9375/g.13697 Transcript_9375/m.13697 type:complete len:219 (-) Transcript_9375:341-997(-)
MPSPISNETLYLLFVSVQGLHHEHCPRHPVWILNTIFHIDRFLQLIRSEIDVTTFIYFQMTPHHRLVLCSFIFWKLFLKSKQGQCTASHMIQNVIGFVLRFGPRRPMTIFNFLHTILSLPAAVNVALGTENDYVVREMTLEFQREERTIYAGHNVVSNVILGVSAVDALVYLIGPVEQSLPYGWVRFGFRLEKYLYALLAGVCPFGEIFSDVPFTLPF